MALFPTPGNIETYPPPPPPQGGSYWVTGKKWMMKEGNNL
jgi:hypothetical protein